MTHGDAQSFSFDLDRYGERIGCGALRGPAREDLLARIHLAHAVTIPFENLDIHLGVPIRLEPERLFEKMVERRRGGYCFEQNGLLMGALQAAGFEVQPLAARVVYGGGPRQPRTHMALRIELGGRRFLADVGFGTHSFLAPLPYEPGVAHDLHGETFRITHEHDVEVRIDGTWTTLYRLSLEEQEPIDFAMGSWFTSTHPSSLFVQSKLVARAGIGRRAELVDRELKVRQGASVERRTIDDEAEWLAALREHFDIELPEGALLRW